MRTLFGLGAVVASALAIGIVPAGAITNGELDGNGHPYVGLMVAQLADGTPLWMCSGTLMSSTVFMTAGHCAEAPAAHVEIWFQSDVQSGVPGNGYPFKGQTGGTPQTNPQYDPGAFYLRDMGVVVLDKPFRMSGYGALPQANVLDSLVNKRGQQDTTFTAVGYGDQRSFPDAAAWKNQELKIRMIARPKVNKIDRLGKGDDYAMILSNNAKTGGTCFGDSGGPNFIGTSNVVGGITSFGRNDTCAGTGGAYRVDRTWNLTWLATFGLSPS